jgi:hypothetical protein
MKYSIVHPSYTSPTGKFVDRTVHEQEIKRGWHGRWVAPIPWKSLGCGCLIWGFIILSFIMGVLWYINQPSYPVQTPIQEVQ